METRQQRLIREILEADVPKTKSQEQDHSLRQQAWDRALSGAPPKTMTPWEWQDWYATQGVPATHTEVTTDITQHWPSWLIADLRSDHAGETGAVMIYRGVLATSRDQQVRDFARRHLDTEQKHLAMVETWLPNARRTRLLPLWRLLGWMTGAIPGLMGRQWVFQTIAAVETFVDEHYQAQLDKLDPAGPHSQLRDVLANCQADEVAHRDEAQAASAGRPSLLLRAWCALVGKGSALAVAASRAA
jgi:ubiquinone biosynthesis monooxygenase Coq7